MPRRPVRRLPFTLAAFVTATTILHAQQPPCCKIGGPRTRPRVFAPIVLRLPVGTRSLGMGGAAVALRDPAAVLANPALLGMRGSVGVSAAYERFGDVSALRAVGASVSLQNDLGVGVAVQTLDWNAPASRYRDAEMGLTLGGSVPAASTVIAIGAARPIFGIRTGVAVKYLEERIGLERGSGSAIDIGAAKNLDRLTLGAALQDLGTTIRIHSDAGTQDIALPTRLTVGASGGGVPLGPFDVYASTALSVRHDGWVTPAGGVELEWMPLDGIGAQLRVGARRPDLREQSPLTAGASVFYDRLALDAAFDGSDAGKNGLRIGLRIR